jgi:hypothetical protein
VRRTPSCWLSPAAVSRGGGGLVGLGRLRALRGLLGSAVGSAVRSAVGSTVGSAVRGGSLRLQSRAATAAATLNRRWVLESQETRAVRQVVVGGGRVGTTLVE